MPSLFPNFEKFIRSAAGMGSADQRAVRDLIESLGPVGRAIAALAAGRRPREIIRRRDIREAETTLQQMAGILEALGYEIEAPEDGELQKRLEGAGFRRVGGGESGEPIEPPPRPSWMRGGAQSRMVGSRRRNYRDDDPILTGEMIPVESSNVHSIGYYWNDENPMRGTLVIRFLQSDKSGRRRGKVGGPVYHYDNVHPDVFEAFRRASSKGKFVWDRIRIRGTVSGHRFPYELAGIAQQYVPRKATRFGPNEYFVGRRVRGGGRTFESSLPDQFAGRPNRGAPETGVPRRGTPNRGRG